MARLFHTGFEANSITTFDASQSGSIITSSPTPANGTYALSHNGRPGACFSIPATTTIFWRCHIYISNGSASATFLGFKDAASGLGEAQTTFQIVAGKLGWANGNRTLQNTGSITIPLNTWTLLEGKVVINATTGTIDTKVGGVADLALTGKNTATHGGTTCDRIDLMLDTGSMNVWSDDWAFNDDSGSINNSWIGEGKVIGLKPNGSAVSNLNGTVGSATHHLNVDELPPNDATDYNYDNS